MVTTPASAPAVPGSLVNLNTLVAAIQNAVQAQNLIATNIKDQLTSLISTVAATNVILTSAFPPPTLAQSAWTPGGVANGASAAISFAVAGVALGQFVKASLAEDLQGCMLGAYVQSAGHIEAVINNNTGGTVTFAATTVRISVASS